MSNGLETLAAPLSDSELANLEMEILAAHAAGATDRLAYGYRTGAEHKLLTGDIDAACFLFTQAYVFALRAGLDEVAEDLRIRLIAEGREA